MSRSNNSGSNNPGRGGYAPAAQHPQQPYQQPAQQPAGQWRHPLDVEDPQQPAPPPPHWTHQQGQQPQADPYAHAQHAPFPQPPPPQGQPPYAQQPPPHLGYEHPAYPAPDDYPPQQQDAYARGGLATYSPGQELSTFAPPPQWPPPQAPESRGGYDFGEYAPGTPPPVAHGHAAADPAFSHDPYGRPTGRMQPPAGWPPQPAQGYPQEPSFGPASGYGQSAPQGTPMAHPGYPSSQVQSPVLAPDPFRAPQASATDHLPHAPATQHLSQQAHAADSSDGMEFEEEEEAPRRGRTLLVVGAWDGAIFVGGGLAYTYRALSGGGKTPILTADKSAVKTKADPSTQKVPQQVPKLPEVAPKVQVASEGDTAGPRRVATIAVGPDGSAQPMPSPPPMAQPQTMTMPGLAVTMPPPMPQREAQLPPQQPPAQVRQQAPAPPVTQAPPVQPRVITPPQPQKQAALPEGQPPAPQKKVVKPKGNDAYTAPSPGTVAGVTGAPAATAKSATGAGGNGFVAAILSTPKGKMEAMKAFADLQAKFPDVLSGKPAEVQEVNLGETKGVWYRAVVGPPGSRSAAAAVCEQLKAAGYTQCFATAY